MTLISKILQIIFHLLIELFLILLMLFPFQKIEPQKTLLSTSPGRSGHNSWSHTRAPLSASQQ